VRYVLEGSVRKAGGRVRITAQLIEAETGAHLWADRFDGSLEYVFDLQEKVAISVAGGHRTGIASGRDRETALRLNPRGQSGMTSYLIGAAIFFSRYFKEAVPKLRVATEEMPGFPTPARFLAACYAHMGLLDKARAKITRLRAFTPEVMANYTLPFRDLEHRELYFPGLRLAAGEKT
jgi:adenylate cyclase